MNKAVFDVKNLKPVLVSGFAATVECTNPSRIRFYVLPWQNRMYFYYQIQRKTLTEYDNNKHTTVYQLQLFFCNQAVKKSIAFGS